MAKSKPKRKKKTAPQPNTFSLRKAIDANKQRLIELCEGVGSNIIDKLTEDDFRMIYISHVSFGKVIAHPGHKVPPQVISNLKKAIKHLLFNREHKTLKPSDILHSYADISIIEGLIYYVERQYLGDEKTKAEVEKDLEYLQEYYGTRVFQEVCRKFLITCIHKYLTIPGKIFYTSHESRTEGNINKFSFQRDYIIKMHHPHKEHIQINGAWRPIFKIQYLDFDLNEGCEYIREGSVNTELIKDYYKGSLKELPIFIQSHAIERLYQRLYPIHISTINGYLYHDISDKIKITLYNNKLLIELNAPIGKLGYFVAEIIEDKLVIKTFLLLSNASTPEGNKFMKLTGFKKMDVHYWDFDFLPTFINNNMTKDNSAYEFFEQAGLLHLFSLKTSASDYPIPDYNGVIDWDKLDDYINNVEENKILSNTELEEVDFEKMLR